MKEIKKNYINVGIFRTKVVRKHKANWRIFFHCKCVVTLLECGLIVIDVVDQDDHMHKSCRSDIFLLVRLEKNDMNSPALINLCIEKDFYIL